VNELEARQDLRARCDEIARIVTGMHPSAAKIGDAATKREILRALFELTRQVEVVKKQLIRLEKQDNSTAL
jgi:hypothetical protein